MAEDRYPVVGDLAEFADWKRKVDAAIDDLRAARPLGQTTVSNGTLTFDDPSGEPRVLIGLMNDGSYGLMFLGPLGNEIFYLSNTDGMVIPGMQLAMVSVRTTVYEAVTNAAFETIFQASTDIAVVDAVNVIVPWSTPAGTTGELRMHNFVFGGATSNVITLAANSSGFAEFKWLHSQQIGAGPFQPRVEARRTGGAGTVALWPPIVNRQIQGIRIGATLAGV